MSCANLADIDFELKLLERRPEGLIISVMLSPAQGRPAHLEGVALNLASRSGECLGHQLLLPIRGRLAGAMSTTVELKVDCDVPVGALVIGHAWCATAQVEATCPAESWTELRNHVRGGACLPLPTADVDFDPLGPAERAAFFALFPWARDRLCVREEPVLLGQVNEPVADLTEDDELLDSDEIAMSYGLSGDDAEFLKEILDEP